MDCAGLHAGAEPIAGAHRVARAGSAGDHLHSLRAALQDVPGGQGLLLRDVPVRLPRDDLLRLLPGPKRPLSTFLGVSFQMPASSIFTSKVVVFLFCFSALRFLDLKPRPPLLSPLSNSDRAWGGLCAGVAPERGVDEGATQPHPGAVARVGGASDRVVRGLQHGLAAVADALHRPECAGHTPPLPRGAQRPPPPPPPPFPRKMYLHSSKLS